MSPWKRVAQVHECPAGQAIEVVVDNQMVALFNVDGTFYALDGVCPHQGGPLGNGDLDGCVVTCPWHGWQFDVRSGKNQLSENIVQPSIACKVEEGYVYVRLG